MSANCDICQEDSEKNLLLLKRQPERMEKEILNVKESRRGRVGQIFKMKDKITGGKRAANEPHAIKDPKTNNMLVSNQDIKKATLEYCADNLRNR